jgi:hypothetical protein
VKQTDERVLLHCFVGCQIDDVLRGLRMEAKELFVGNEGRPALSQSPSPDRKIVAQYPYTDEAGALLYEVVRFEPKDFRQRRPRVDGGWEWTLGDVRRVLYRLPELIEQERAIYCEGEKDVDRLWSVGLPATTACAGAASWRPAYAADMAKLGIRELVIIPDNDEPGEKYASVVAAAARAAGLRVKLVRLPGVGPKGDVSDWLDAGGTASALQVLINDQPWVDPAEVALPEGVLSGAAIAGRGAAQRIPNGAVVRQAELVLMRGSKGELICPASRPGVGKTALVSRGQSGRDGRGWRAGDQPGDACSS